MKKLFITEKQEKILAECLNEEIYQMPVDKKYNKPYSINPEKVLIVKKFLDKGFTPHDYEKIGENGLPIKIKVISMNASNGEVLKYMYQDQLQDLLIDRFQNMFSDKIERELFMGQVIKDWLNKKIGIFGNLSTNRLLAESMTSEEIDERANKANINPTYAQKKAGNYSMGHIIVQGMPISIENPKGSKRYWKDEEGNEGYNVMKNHYGYFKKTSGNGRDGDAIDVFIGPDPEATTVYVVDQKINGKFDESKVMLGFKSITDAKKAYMSNYSKDWKGFMDITGVDIDVFKKWLYDGRKQRKAFSEYKGIKLNETVNKIVKNILFESQESKSQSEAIKLLQKKLGWDYEKSDNFVRNDLRNDITSLRDKKIAKFTLGVTRMFINGDINNASVKSELNTTLKLLLAHLDDYDRNLNNLSAQELISKFERTRRDNLENERNEIDSMEFGEFNYQIIPINSFEEAEKYYGYTYPIDRWCLTYREDMFDYYTSDGINQIYFCLRKGFENVEPINDENAPLDEYGLSMLSIIVNENGELVHCTTRWNHENGGSDSAMNAKQISEIVGVNFYQTFKPNNKWKELVTSVEQRLANGEDYEYVFDNYGIFSEGFARVELNDKWNFINQEGKFLSNQWFDNCNDFYHGFAAVWLNGKCNLINQEGKLISNQWFDDCGYFEEGFVRVELNEKWNFINEEGKLISNQWFDDCGVFNEGFARVWLNGKCNFINEEDKLISNQWFDDCNDFYHGFSRVLLNGKCNLINREGKLISKQWFDVFGHFGNNGFSRIKLNEKWNYINQEGKLISNQWFDNCRDFNNGFGRVWLNGKWNYINREGKLISNQWFDDCGDFNNGFGRVWLNGKWYFINQDGELFDSDGNPVNINENISKKYKNMKINESKIRHIVNESIKRVLLEDKDQTRLTNILIKKLYKVAQNYKRLYEDNDWTYLRALMDDLANVPGVRDFNYGGGKYHQNGKEFGESAYKLYTVEIETEFDTIIRGEVYCNFAGTIADPWSRYDMTVNFWRDSEINDLK